MNIEQLKNMSQGELDNLMRSLVGAFDTFANNLSNSQITQFAPPFPQYSESDKDVLDFCYSIFQEYIDSLKSLGNDTLQRVDNTMRAIIEIKSNKRIAFDIIKETELMCNTILESISKLFKGLPSEAIIILEKGILSNDCHLANILTRLEVGGGKTLYRVRKTDETLSDRKELFHIPFEERHKCGSYRYSILGYPSLYLSGSVETALKECRVENGQHYYCSAYSFNKARLTFLDLSLLPYDKLSFIDQYSFVVTYPLIIACGLKVKKENNPYKPEYAFPQALFQFIRLHTNFDGISYTSTRYENPNYKDFRHRNYIMSITGADRRNGYSKDLATKLLMTDPVRFNDTGDILQKESKLKNSTFHDIVI